MIHHRLFCGITLKQNGAGCTPEAETGSLRNLKVLYDNPHEQRQWPGQGIDCGVGEDRLESQIIPESTNQSLTNA